MDSSCDIIEYPSDFYLDVLSDHNKAKKQHIEILDKASEARETINEVRELKVECIGIVLDTPIIWTNAWRHRND